ncbi:hypothetical protein D3C80_2192340 [compost metagenome]
MYYGTFRATGAAAFLFNVKADSKYQAIRKGEYIYRGFHPENAIRRLYSIDEHTARPLNREQCEILDSREKGP